ncbi:hypothetical protein EYR38_003360 [Pleurotus pulmonarius]|nr:hypothetical protein EYR38_003360 [Pleurotus pulmonarius]
MMPFLLRPLLSVFFLFTLAQAANDWSKPCFEGQCEYDLPSWSPSSGTVKICGRGPFAYISKAWTPEDWSISSDVRSRIVRRDGQALLIRALRINTDLGSIQTTGDEPVSFTLYGTNMPGMDLSDIDNDRRRDLRHPFNGLNAKFHRHFNKHGSIKLNSIKFDKKTNLFNQSTECPPPVKATVSVDINTEATVSVTIGIVASGTMIPPKLVNFESMFGVTADLSGRLDLSAELSGVLDSGKINLLTLPIDGLDFPGLFSVGPSFQVDAEAKATLDVVTDLSIGLNYRIQGGHFEFPPNANLPKRDFLLPQDTPLRLSASPSVKATGSIEAHIIPRLNLGVSVFDGAAGANVFLEFDTSAKAALSVNAAAEVATALLAAPTSTASPARQNVARQATASPLNASQGPTGSVPASIESSALAQPSITEGPSTTISTIGSTSSTSTFTSVPAVSESSSSLSSSSLSIFTTIDPGVNVPSTTSEVSSSDPVSTSQVDSGASTSVGGCFDISAGFDVNIGADASFAKFFNANTTTTVLTKQFHLFKKCFGEQANGRRGLRTKARFLGRRAGLGCSPSGPEPLTLANEVVSADAIKAV